jgi:hypothetical protein
MKKILSIITHPIVMIAISISLAALFSYNEFVILAYIFYAFPILLFFYMFIKHIIFTIKDLKEIKVYKKNKGLLTGNIKDSKGNPVKYTNVVVKNSDGSMGHKFSGRYVNMTNKEGNFKISRLPYGDFLLEIHVDSHSLKIPFSITKEKTEVIIEESFK